MAWVGLGRDFSVFGKLGRVRSKFFPPVMCWIGLGQSADGLGWVGSGHTKWTHGQLWITWSVVEKRQMYRVGFVERRGRSDSSANTVKRVTLVMVRSFDLSQGSILQSPDAVSDVSR